MSERAERCDGCKFWRATEDEPPSPEGWCQRHAPRPEIIPGYRESGVASEYVVWPLTMRADWCGEFQPAAPPVSKWAAVSAVDYLGLSVRADNCLSFERITTVEELLGKTAGDLLEMRNFGMKLLAEVRDKLAIRGLYLKGDEPAAPPS